MIYSFLKLPENIALLILKEKQLKKWAKMPKTILITLNVQTNIRTCCNYFIKSYIWYFNV